jgi:4-hydroxy-2-oxoheptanedioate aldolase
MGVAPRVELMDFKDAEPYLKMGVKHFCVGWDVFIIQRFCQEQGAAFRKAFGS